VEIIIAGLVFIGLFFAWVILPTFFKKQHSSDKKNKEDNNNL
jgi:hypothetical protein